MSTMSFIEISKQLIFCLTLKELASLQTLEVRRRFMVLSIRTLILSVGLHTGWLQK